MLPSAVLILLAAQKSAYAQANADDGVIELVAIVLTMLVFLGIFFVPSFVAFSRQHPNRWPIFLINKFFGATGLGWLGSLMWACKAIHRSDFGSHGGESGLNVFANDVRHLALPNLREPPRQSIDGLRRLKMLLEQGAIDEHEYAYLKQKTLDNVR